MLRLYCQKFCTCSDQKLYSIRQELSKKHLSYWSAFLLLESALQDARGEK